MDNLQLRMEKIRQRSEIYMQKRKKCRRMAAACVLPALCICLAVGAHHLRGLTDRNGAMDAAPEQMLSGAAGAPESNSVMDSVENADTGTQITVTDPEQAARLREMLSAFWEMSVSIEDNAHAQYGSEDVVAGATGKTDQLYTFGLQTEAIYELAGNILCNKTTGQIFCLTEEQLSQLRQLLGI